MSTTDQYFHTIQGSLFDSKRVVRCLRGGRLIQAIHMGISVYLALVLLVLYSVILSQLHGYADDSIFHAVGVSVF